MALQKKSIGDTFLAFLWLRKNDQSLWVQLIFCILHVGNAHKTGCITAQGIKINRKNVMNKNKKKYSLRC